VIESIPICMLAVPIADSKHRDSLQQGFVSYDLSGHCNERYFEKLPGYIDLAILSMDNCMTINEIPFSMAASVCLLRQPEDIQLVLYESTISAAQKKESNQLEDLIVQYEKKLETFEHDSTQVIGELATL